MKPLNALAINGLTATGNSVAYDATFMFYVSVIGNTTGTLAGTLKLQASDDFDISGTLSNFTPTNWYDIPSATVSLTGTAGVFGIPKTELSYRWIRVSLTVSGGTGTATFYIAGKGA